MTACQGCESGEPATAYRVTSHAGASADVTYCRDCAELAGCDWSGEVSAIARCPPFLEPRRYLAGEVLRAYRVLVVRTFAHTAEGHVAAIRALDPFQRADLELRVADPWLS